ncbi:MAG: hypothetical protein AAFV95_28375 [Bacteroidota bacterium]
MKTIQLLFTAFLVLANLHMLQAQTIVLKTDAEGKVVQGAIDSLIAQIHKGKNLRVGWQLDLDKDGNPDLEHWVEAEFISILNGHVFNQIAPIYRQSPKMDIPQIQISNSKTQWTAVIGTNGKLISRYIIPDVELVEDERMKKVLEQQTTPRERTVPTIWVVSE